MLKDVIRKTLGKDRELVPVVMAPQRSGIYFLLWKGEVVYVGQSVDVDARISTHQRERLKQFNAAVFLPFEEHELSYYEDAFIRVLNPKHNKGDRSHEPRLKTPIPPVPAAWSAPCAEMAVGFIANTDEDGIVFDDLFDRYRKNGGRCSRITFTRIMDKDPRVVWCQEDMKYRLRGAATE